MTERGGDPAAQAQAERIRDLQARRGRGANDATARRKHPAAASRILAVGVTIASFFGVVTAFGIRQNAASPASSTPVVAPTPVAASPVAASPAPTTPATTPQTAIPQAAAPQAAPRPVPQTTTRGS